MKNLYHSHLESIWLNWYFFWKKKISISVSLVTLKLYPNVIYFTLYDCWFIWYSFCTLMILLSFSSLIKNYHRIYSFSIPIVYEHVNSCNKLVTSRTFGHVYDIYMKQQPSPNSCSRWFLVEFSRTLLIF